MKRYIWKPEIFIENVKELGYTLLALFLVIATSICPSAWI